MRKYDLAIADLNRAIELDPHRPQAYEYRAHVLSVIGESERSIADFSKAIEFLEASQAKFLDVTERALFHARARAYASLGDLERAMADVDHLILKYPYLHNFYVTRGELFERLGQTERALADFARARELQGQSGWTVRRR